MQMSLKCADLGHLASPKHVHRKWVQKLEEEVRGQGEGECALCNSLYPPVHHKWVQKLEEEVRRQGEGECAVCNSLYPPIHRKWVQKLEAGRGGAQSN